HVPGLFEAEGLFEWGQRNERRARTGDTRLRFLGGWTGGELSLACLELRALLRRHAPAQVVKMRSEQVDPGNQSELAYQRGLGPQCMDLGRCHAQNRTDHAHECLSAPDWAWELKTSSASNMSWRRQHPPHRSLASAPRVLSSSLKGDLPENGCAT